MGPPRPLLDSLDLALLRWSVALPHPTALNWLMIAVTSIGVSGIVWLAMAADIAARLRGKAIMGAWRVALAVGLSLIAANLLIKPLVDRPRPFVGEPHLAMTSVRPATPSFPSGHAASAVAGAYALSLLLPSRRKWFWALAVLMAFTRLYLGVHYPSDVIAAAVVGWACAVFATAKTPCYISGSLPRSA
jgi:undecaprenyl-diphosphatase